jgi:hypothetical protein
MPRDIADSKVNHQTRPTPTRRRAAAPHPPQLSDQAAAGADAPRPGHGAAPAPDQAGAAAAAAAAPLQREGSYAGALEEAVLHNANDFLKWHSQLEAACASEAELKYQNYAALLRGHLAACDAIRGKVTAPRRCFSAPMSDSITGGLRSAAGPAGTMCLRVCVCVCARARVCLCMCVCVCVCVFPSGPQRKATRDVRAPPSNVGAGRPALLAARSAARRPRRFPPRPRPGARSAPPAAPAGRRGQRSG